MASGIAFKIPFELYKNHLSDFILLSDDELIEGIYLALVHTHNLAEAAGASTIMAAQKIANRLQGKNVVLQMSGCNETMANVRKVLSKYQ